MDAADEAARKLLVRLHKMVFICEALKLRRTDLSLLQMSADDKHGFIALDCNALPLGQVADAAIVSAFEKLVALAELRHKTPHARHATDLLHQYAALDLADNATTPAAAKGLVAGGLAVSPDEAGTAAGQVHIVHVDQYRDPATLDRLIDLFVAAKALGATIAETVELAAPSLNDGSAGVARRLLHTKYDQSQWHDLIKPIADTMRIRQRDALVDYLLDRTHLHNADDLYERYLIDVQIGSCLKTTRLLQATAAAQLFIQRVLLNLEKDLSLTADKRQLWDWMHNYRVWEANRKVFLFPENWLLPELRDDKTEIFRQFESALTAKELSPETARSALLGYLEDFGEMAQINVIAMHEDLDIMGTPVLHVVGRTPNQPYHYFWRSCTKFAEPEMSWSGWEALDLDNANDFIMPFVLGGDLHVAWPTFRKTTTEMASEVVLGWDVTLHWKRRDSNGWTKGKASHDVLTTPRLIGMNDSRSFVFNVRKKKVELPLGANLKQERITVDCYAADEDRQNRTVEYIPPPDPARLNLHPSGEGGAGGYYNVKLSATGTIWEWYKPNTSDPIVYRRAQGAYVRLSGGYQDGGPKTFDLEATADTNGDFAFAQREVTNGSEVTLTIELSGSLQTFVYKEPLEKDGDQFAVWNWVSYYSFEIDAPEDTPFNSDRPVSFGTPAGSFHLEPGRDARILTPSDAPALDEMGMGQQSRRLANRFISLPGGRTVDLPYVGTLAVDHVVTDQISNNPVEVAPLMSKLPFASDQTKSTWHVRDAAGPFYLQVDGSIRTAWPDGQEFADSYRDVAGGSPLQLFDPSVQSWQRNALPGHTPPSRLAGLSTTFSEPRRRFDRSMPFADYNYELFLHAALTISDNFAKDHQFAEARKWLHAVFDPTTDEMIGGVSQYWRFMPFRNDSQPGSIAQMLTWLADPKATDPDTPDFETKFAAQIKEWKQNPFMPHLVARMRPSAYQWHTFFAYLDVLIGWGDQLFRRDTREWVNDATLLYVLAARLLGPRPRVIPAVKPAPPPQTYRSLPRDASGDLDAFSNAWLEYSDLAGVKQATVTGDPSGIRTPNDSVDISKGTQVLSSLGALAFCIPQNDKVTEFYDLIENRLWNIRNCRNIDGVYRELPLYEPPIDPLLLIRARAAGLDINSVLDDLYSPLPNHRFTFTMQKALELCAELKALGAALLSALEKDDAEGLALLRSTHEIAMLKLVSDTRKQQIAEAEANIAALRQSEETIKLRLGQYQKLLGKPSLTLGQDGLPVVEQSSTLAVATDPIGGASGLGLTRKEIDQLVLGAIGHTHTQAANAAHVLSGVLSLVPETTTGATFLGVTFGGRNLGSAASALAKAIEIGATEANYFASVASTFGGYERRQDEWVHQSKLAVAELRQIEKQIVASEIRKGIAERELSNQETQIENAHDIDDFMRSKFTNQQLHRWMSSKIAEVYFGTYQLALDQARRVERSYQYELAPPTTETPFVKTGQWDSLRRGLLAGEQLHHDLKRMESAYLMRNTREFEITKHISLLQLQPEKLLKLKETGVCDFDVPEILFDIDFPGHYMRRIKMVTLSIPCVTGPYASVSATLRLNKNQIRVAPVATDPHYNLYWAETPPFKQTLATISAIVTSSAQQDGGMFEPTMRDERYLPFEGAGVTSQWHVELPTKWPSFDYSTIADVILHLRYTARDGGDAFKDEATSAVTAMVLQATEELKLYRLVSLRREFPANWNQFLTAADAQTLDFSMSQDRFPFEFNDRTIQINAAKVFLKLKDLHDSTTFMEDHNNPTPLGDYTSLGLAPTVGLVPPGVTPVPRNAAHPPISQLAADASVGLPHADIDFVEDFDGARTTGKWSVTIVDEDVEVAPSLQYAIAPDKFRLKPDLIDDVIIILQYSILRTDQD